MKTNNYEKCEKCPALEFSAHTVKKDEIKTHISCLLDKCPDKCKLSKRRAKIIIDRDFFTCDYCYEKTAFAEMKQEFGDTICRECFDYACEYGSPEDY